MIGSFVISLLLSAAAGQAAAGTASMRGFVQDEQGGVIRGAVVEWPAAPFVRP